MISIFYSICYFLQMNQTGFIQVTSCFSAHVWFFHGMQFSLSSEANYARNSSESEKKRIHIETWKHESMQIPSEGLKPLYQQDIYQLSFCSN